MGGTESNTTRFLTCIQEEMSNEIYMFRCNGLSTIVMMKGKAAGIFKLGFENESDDQILQEVATEIKTEIKETSSYNINDNYPKLDYDLSLKSCSPTLMKLLSMISPKLNNTLRSVMIGNLITSGASNGTTMLQVSLGAIVNRKKIIEYLHDYGIVATYDEVRRLKESAAAVANSPLRRVDLEASHGLIQGVSDNFDASIFSQNGLVQTHSMATILIQPSMKNTLTRPSIPRIKKDQMKSIKIQDVKMQNHIGQKKPAMTTSYRKNILPLKVLSYQSLVVHVSKTKDCDFIKSILKSDDVPDHHGFSTKVAREMGQEVGPKSNILFRPLINKPPSDPSTVLTCMHDVEKKQMKLGKIFLY